MTLLSWFPGPYFNISSHGIYTELHVRPDFKCNTQFHSHLHWKLESALHLLVASSLRTTHFMFYSPPSSSCPPLNEFSVLLLWEKTLGKPGYLKQNTAAVIKIRCSILFRLPRFRVSSFANLQIWQGFHSIQSNGRRDGKSLMLQGHDTATCFEISYLFIVINWLSRKGNLS